MSQSPDHDQSAVPATDSQPPRPDTASLPLPYGQEPWDALPDQQPVPLPPPDEAATRRQELSQPATPFGDEPTLPGRTIPPQQQKSHTWPLALWLPPALILNMLLALFGLHALLQAIGQATGTPTTGLYGQYGTVTSTTTKSTPRGAASATARSTQPRSATRTATAFPTATPRPTATPVPVQFSVSPLTKYQTCSAVLLPSFLVTLSNQTASSVGYQVTAVTYLPGTTKPWASVSPANGTIPAGAQRPVDVTPNSMLCTDSLFHGTQAFKLTVTAAVSGTSRIFTVTDYVTRLV
jgi:hypothetical protein